MVNLRFFFFFIVLFFLQLKWGGAGPLLVWIDITRRGQKCWRKNSIRLPGDSPWCTERLHNSVHIHVSLQKLGFYSVSVISCLASSHGSWLGMQVLLDSNNNNINIITIIIILIIIIISARALTSVKALLILLELFFLLLFWCFTIKHKELTTYNFPSTPNCSHT